MVDLLKITGDSELYNFHTHTQFCDGHATMEEFVVEAINENFKLLGFSPHAPIPLESPCNMSRDSVPDYLAEIERLRGIYGQHIHICASMEIDYVDGFGAFDRFFGNLPLDYRIGSVHFIPSFDNPNEYVDIDGSIEKFKEKMRKYFHHDIERVVKSFYKQSMDMIDCGGFEVIGHFDKIGNNASMFRYGIDEEAWYDQLVIDLFENIMDHHLTVEINTKAYMSSNRFFPNLKYFGMLKKYKAPIIINSDAHHPHLLNSGRQEALHLYNVL